MLQRSSPHADNIHEFDNAVRLFYDRQSVATSMTNYPNLEHLLPLMQSIPVLWLQQQNQKMLVVSVIFIAKGARVMRTANLWQEVGLCNGAAGTVYDFIYQDGHAPPDLPVAVLVQFDNYSGPPFFNNCAPIVPITHEWVSGRQHLSRQCSGVLLYVM